MKTPSMKTADKSEQQWRAELTPEQFSITREKGTEAPLQRRILGLQAPGNLPLHLLWRAVIHLGG